MTRKKLLASKEYWITQMVAELHQVINDTVGTQKELCKRSGISPSHLSEILSQEKSCSIAMYVKILLACGKVPIITIENLKDQK